MSLYVSDDHLQRSILIWSQRRTEGYTWGRRQVILLSLEISLNFPRYRLLFATDRNSAEISDPYVNLIKIFSQPIRKLPLDSEEVNEISFLWHLDIWQSVMPQLLNFQVEKESEELIGDSAVVTEEIFRRKFTEISGGEICTFFSVLIICRDARGTGPRKYPHCRRRYFGRFDGHVGNVTLQRDRFGPVYLRYRCDRYENSQKILPNSGQIWLIFS